MRAPRPPIAVLAVALAAIAWTIGLAGHYTQPARLDFVALYAGARLVATGRGSLVTDADALLAIEREVQPARTVLLNNPNLPALSGVLAPLGLLPYDAAFVVMLTLSALALAAAALLMLPLTGYRGRGRLLLFVMLAPPSIIALVQGQTTPFVLLCLVASLRRDGFVSGLLLGAIALRPQLLPLLAVASLHDRARALGLLVACAVVGLLSLAVAGPEGLARYPERLAYAAAEVGLGEVSLPALARRAGVEPLTALLGGALLTAAAVPFAFRRPAGSAVAALVAAPHALLHDLVFAYPALVAATSTAPAAWGLALAVVAGTLLQLAGVPAMQLILPVLAIVALRRHIVALRRHGEARAR